MKKKEILIFVCTVLASVCLLLVGCGGSGSKRATTGSAPKNPYVGTWKVTHATFNKKEVSIKDYAGGDVYLEIKADGTARLTMGKDVTEGTWKEKRKGIQVKGGGKTLQLEMKDGKLETSIMGAKITLERQ